jgi:hypothetical protein
MVERSLQSAPSSAVRLDTKGWILHRMGRRDEAVEILARASSLAPGSDVIRDHLAVARAAGR